LNQATGKPHGLHVPVGRGERRFSYSDTRPLASRLSRLGAVLLDSVFGLIVYAPLVVVVVAERGPESKLDSNLQIVLAVVSLVCILILAVVQIVLLSLAGQTLGKMLLGIRIVRNGDGSRAGFVHAFLLRAFVPGLIESVPCVGPLFAIVNILYIFGEERRCVHDYIADTKVVVD
jgi:uncharacterized RDD family membrane protein YckC